MGWWAFPCHSCCCAHGSHQSMHQSCGHHDMSKNVPLPVQGCQCHGLTRTSASEPHKLISQFKTSESRERPGSCDRRCTRRSNTPTPASRREGDAQKAAELLRATGAVACPTARRGSGWCVACRNPTPGRGAPRRLKSPRSSDRARVPPNPSPARKQFERWPALFVLDDPFAHHAKMIGC
jgi:hypothetical protein